jgi:geranylgeranylglycerol-phosphate geranylgeranyltransferase
MNPYIEIIRPFTSFLSAFGVLTGALVAGSASPQLILTAAVAVFCISGAGIILNDVYDMKIDKINAPWRALPSKRMSKRNALVYSLLLFAAGILLAYSLNIYCFALAALNSILEFAYARNLKQVALVGNALDSWFVVSAFIFGALITGGIIHVLILSILAFLANMGREIFGDIEDLKGDNKLGLKTLPILAGERVSWFIASSFILMAVCLSALPYYLGLMGLGYLVLVAAADLLFIFSIFQEPKINQKVTKIAMLIAMVAFIAGALL